MLLRSRITKPVYSPGVVARARLHALLARWQETRAIVVHAPSGYGKSTLLSQWIDAAGLAGQAAWLTLDESDGEPRQFVSDVAAALEPVIHGVAATVRPILEDPQDDAARALQRLLSAVEEEMISLAVPDEHVLLVLDDLHRAQSPEIDRLLTTVLEHGPRNLHLILMARSRPTLPLARLYTHGALTFLTTDDLRFTDAEVRAYLLNMGFASPSAADVHQLTQRCEGWVAALRLSLLASPRRDSVTALFTKMESGRDWIFDYLIEEVLQRQTDEVRRFLLETSLLDAFNAPLCAAVIGVVPGIDHAQRILTEITRSDLFIIPLDRTGEWFRYHHLFQELLQRRLQAHSGVHAVAELHRRAAVWLADTHNVTDAVGHFLAADDIDLATDLVACEVHARMMRDPYGTQRLLNLLRDHKPHVQLWPRLLIDRCRLAFLFDSSDLARLVAQAETALACVPATDSQLPMLHAELLVVRTAAELQQSAINRAVETANQAQSSLHLLDDFMAGSLHFLQMHLCNARGLDAMAGKWATSALAAFTRADFRAGMVALQRETARWLMHSGAAQVATQRFGQLSDEHAYG